MSLREEIREWAELNGSSGCCPRCGKGIWVESGCAIECQHCGYIEGDCDDEDEDQEPDSDRTLGLCLGRD